MNMNNPDIQKALVFATAAHAAINQRRKYTDEPYIVHPIRLAKDALTRPWATVAVVQALLLHDVVEDTRYFVDGQTGDRVERPAEHLKSGRPLRMVEGITLDLIGQMFGEEVRQIVSGLTDTAMPWDGVRAVRMAINRDHALAQPAIVQNAKLIDIKDNIVDIARNDPGFARKYLPEKYDIFKGLKLADPDLRAEVQETFGRICPRKV
jgi:hypothetical protein